MKVLSLPAVCLAAAVCVFGQPQEQPAAPKAATLPSLPDNKVVATCPSGASVTMAQLRNYIGILDPQAQQTNIGDLQGYFDRLCMARKLEQMALDDKLEQTSPVKERLEFERMQVLDEAEVNKLSNPSNVDGSELEAFYNSTKAKYQQFKLDDIYIGFTLSDTPAAPGEPKTLTKAEARAKIGKLLDQIKAGADFQKLAVQNSDDEKSRERNGYFETLSPADMNIPDIVRSAIFKLEPGQVTDVIEQPAGFYLFKAESVIVKPYSEVRDQVYADYKTQRFNQLVEDMRRQNKAVLAPELLKN